MRLYILRFAEKTKGASRLVIRAGNSTQARRLAQKDTGNDAWLDAERCVCVSLPPTGKPGIILVQ